MAGFGWLTQVGDRAYDRARDLRPEKNLQRNREIVARTREEAGAKADAEYQALLAQETSASPIPAVTAAPVGAPEAPQPGNAKTIWDAYAEERDKINAEFAAKASADPSSVSQEEFLAAQQELQAKREQLTKMVGAPPVGSREWMNDNAARMGNPGGLGGASVTGAQSTSTMRGGSGEPVRQVAEKFLMDQLLTGPADTRRDEIYLRNLSKARDQVLPTLWGTEGADGVDQEIAAVSNRLSGKDATKLEIARLNNAAKVSTSYVAKDATMARAEISKDALALKERLGTEANRLRGMALDQKKLEEFGRMIRSTRDNVMKNLTSLRSYAGSQGGFLRDAATGQLISTQDALAQSEGELQRIEALLGYAQEGMFRTGEDVEKAIQSLGQAGSLNPQYARAAVTEAPGFLGQLVGQNVDVRNPGFTPVAPAARIPMTGAPNMGGGFSLTYRGTGETPVIPQLEPGKPRARKKGPAGPGPVELVWKKGPDGKMRKVPK